MPPFIGATYDVSCGTVHCEKYSSSPNGYLEMLCSKYIGNLNSGEPDSIPSPIRLYSCPSNLNCPLRRTGDSQEGVANRLKHNAGHEFSRNQTISSTAEQDAAFNNAAQKYGNEDYRLLTHNCYQLGIAGVDAANKADPNNKIDIDKSIIPNNGFNGNQGKGWTER